MSNSTCLLRLSRISQNKTNSFSLIEAGQRLRVDFRACVLTWANTPHVSSIVN